MALQFTHSDPKVLDKQCRPKLLKDQSDQLNSVDPDQNHLNAPEGYPQFASLSAAFTGALSQENLPSGFATRYDSNWPAQPQRLLEVLKFRI